MRSEKRFYWLVPLLWVTMLVFDAYLVNSGIPWLQNDNFSWCCDDGTPRPSASSRSAASLMRNSGSVLKHKRALLSIVERHNHTTSADNGQYDPSTSAQYPPSSLHYTEKATTRSPTAQPTPSPTRSPTAEPTPSPTNSPTAEPTPSPTPSPTLTTSYTTATTEQERETSTVDRSRHATTPEPSASGVETVDGGQYSQNRGSSRAFEQCVATKATLSDRAQVAADLRIYCIILLVIYLLTLSWWFFYQMARHCCYWCSKDRFSNTTIWTSYAYRMLGISAFGYTGVLAGFSTFLLDQVSKDIHERCFPGTVRSQVWSDWDKMVAYMWLLFCMTALANVLENAKETIVMKRIIDRIGASRVTHAEDAEDYRETNDEEFDEFHDIADGVSRSFVDMRRAPARTQRKQEDVESAIVGGLKDQ